MSEPTSLAGMDVAGMLRQALAHHQAGRLQEAEPLYRAVLQADPGQADANHNLGVLAMQLNQPGRALGHLKAALDANPGQGQYWLSYIAGLMQAGQSDAARQVLAQGRERGLQGEAVEALARRLGGQSAGAASGAQGTAEAPTPAEISQLMGLFNQGRYAELEPQARALTLRFPEHGFGWKMLGAVLKQMGRTEESLAPLQKAAALLPGDANVHTNLGLTFHELGRLFEEEASYRRALEVRPDFVPAHHNLGNTLLQQQRLDEAEVCYRRVLEIKADYAEAHCSLGATLKAQGRLSEAEASYRRALALRPNLAEAHVNLSGALIDQGRLSEAEASSRRSLELRPDFAEAHSNLGLALHDMCRLAEAEASYRCALKLKPDYADAHYNLGNTLRDQGRLSEAEASFRRALEIHPHHVEAHNNLGATLRDQGWLLEAEASYRQVLQIRPEWVEAHSNMGSVLSAQGRLTEAEASFRRALEIRPDFSAAYGNLLFGLNYDPDKSAEEIFGAYREYEERFGVPLRGSWCAHANSRQSRRRLKVGYVSPDFRIHATCRFLEPLLAAHDRSVVEVYAYAELKWEDALTARYKGYVEHWVPTVGVSDEALAERIRADGIDILVDLAGHTAGNRLGVFARKPAPVSVSWLGYGYTTGLAAIDYLLTDEASAPAGSEGLFSETPWRVATPCYVYRPAQGMGEVSSLPARERGYVSLGTLTRAVRINHRSIRVWSQILKRLPGARLVIDSRDFQEGAMQELLAAKFAAQGIERGRLQIGYHSPPWEVLRGMDIGLDCFPHNSGTTLFETLYMGVPYVTLAGRPSVGRLGSSVLQGVGHPEWIAASEEEYVQKVVSLASDVPGLEVIRGRLRGQMQAGVLMDEAGFARKVEAAYRQMWIKWIGMSQ